MIRERLNEYEKKTRPLADFYLRRQALLDVDAEGAPEELTERLLEKLGPLVLAGAGKQ